MCDNVCFGWLFCIHQMGVYYVVGFGVATFACHFGFFQVLEGGEHGF
jgi:hypothetical protein